MNIVFKSVVTAMVLGVAVNAFAIEKDITVNATVDATLDITQSDGEALPSSIDMQYIPGVGLSPYSIDTKIWSNDAEKDINASITANPTLNNTTGAGATTLDVKLGGKVLTATPQAFAGTELFPTAETKQGSITLPLVIQQTVTQAIPTGQYTGMVSLILTQATE
ncbi:CS1 type fimbrial major subunit [Scandinavium goeteborgense]|uniref:CS1 type fimbrial major subunit n=1 Tax=Scandinavium goeteborgense TaxID=1851514 RepID=UPI000F689759|nr:CS1 type fimbrial major subunit [Scandinavium goeteborgense]QKN81606.1 hypothetical protein A8O29_010075 [Scandinavium goeteborgense]